MRAPASLKKTFALQMGSDLVLYILFILRIFFTDLKMFLSEIRQDIEALSNNILLFEESNFSGRTEAMDDIDFYIIDRIDSLVNKLKSHSELAELKQLAENLRSRLEEIDNNLFIHLRSSIRSANLSGIAFKNAIDKYLANSQFLNQDEMGYDNLDLLVNGIFSFRALPDETMERETEMVFFQKTPARIIFELVEKAHFSESDVFYDLGSGLGQVCMLVNLMSGVISKGVEFEPEFCNYARICSAELNLKNVEFINDDARFADYSDGTVFFMYTPFTGGILEDVMNILYIESQKRMIRLFTYGPCTLDIVRINWLSAIKNDSRNPNKLNEFRSFNPRQ